MIVPGYRIAEEVLRSRDQVLWRGRGEADGRPVLIKALLRPGEDSSARNRLKRECDLLESLDLPGVVRARTLLPSTLPPVLLLEDPGGVCLKARLLAGQLPLRTTLRIGCQLADVLSGLHGRSIVHRDLNPLHLLFQERTGIVTLVTLDSATRLAVEQSSPTSLSNDVASLPYCSPEQTGRMNRDVDYRTDLYSLGVILYQLLCGRLPFDSWDPLELVHAHIARIPATPSHVDPSIPAVLSAIVMKLLEKTAEARYQSASGVESDLRRCLESLDASGTIPTFALGERDVAERFAISQRLYGRDHEVGALRSVFERTCAGAVETVMVSGYSGIGKTSIVNELHRSLSGKRGHFVAGKFDQLARNIPYAAITQAFEGLIRQVMTESEAAVEQWRDALRSALGPSGQVIAEVIPVLELLLGELPAAPPLGPAESQNRFNLLFQKFVGAFASADHPLVIFLDDIQWADSASLALLRATLTSPDLRHLMLIGAYRDNEVGTAHPLLRMCSELREDGIGILELFVRPLRLEHLEQLIADTLHWETEDCRPLAELVLRKTAGNPFFVTQFLISLYRDEVLRFDPAARRWEVELARVEALGITDNVVDLMARRIRKLDSAAQQVLQLAGCLGNRFDLETLGIVHRSTMGDTLRVLWPAIEEGLVLPVDNDAQRVLELVEGAVVDEVPVFRFLHDRVQQAAYALVPETDRRCLHLRIGRLLREHFDPRQRESRVFELADQLGWGLELIEDPSERLEVAELNAAAGARAKASAAFRPALAYFENGCRLLPADRWESVYALSFSLYLELAECQYLCGRFEDAEGTCSTLLAQARSAADRAEVYLRMIVRHENLGRYEDAVRYAELGLQGFGIQLPASDAAKRTAFESELARIRERLERRSIAELLELPTLANAEVKSCMRLLMAAWAPAYIAANTELVALLPAMVVRLSLEHGNTEESACGYVLHGITAGTRLGDYRSGFEFGRLALSVNARFQDLQSRAKVHHLFSCFVNLWSQPLRTCFPYAREAYRSGIESGDLPYASYGVFHLSWYGLLTSRDLEAFQQEFGSNVEFLRGIRNSPFAELQQLILSWGRALQGLTNGPTLLTNEDFSEEQFRTRYGDLPFFEVFLWVPKLHLLYTFGEYAAALEAAREAERVVHSLSGTIWPALLTFYHALTLAALYPDAPPREQQQYLSALEPLGARLDTWATNCPQNFGTASHLVRAEIARVTGSTGVAIEEYEHALRASGASELVLERALARELYARFWQARGESRIASIYLAEAHQIYEGWGAAAKARSLVGLYGDLVASGSRPLENRVPGLVGAPSESGLSAATEPGSLDATTLMKAAHLIAEEIDLDRLLSKLMRVLLENAGAQRGYLLLESEGELRIRARGTADEPDVQVLQPGDALAAADLPMAVVNYVRRTGESVVLADAPADTTFGNDRYVREAHPRSVLCTPVLNQGRLLGVLYLENNLVAGAFSLNRLQVTQLLSTQAAIAIANAGLFREVSRLRDRLQAENVYLQEEIKTQHGFEEIIGRGAALERVLRQVEQVAPTDATVLITGETGTGKELIARAIHTLSGRRERALVTVNCGAISAGLVESELFGHEKGAFTGALQRKIGRFELADGGTIFLDEIGDLPLDLQVKLLRVLQEGEVERVGGGRTIPVNVRVIAATHRDLSGAVGAGTFRSDLFYRLAVFPIHLPPLRERAEDIPLLVRYFVTHFGVKLGKRIDSIPRHVLETLSAYAWPGNIRELRNVIERSVIISTGPTLQIGEWLTATHPLGGTPSGAAGRTTSHTLHEVERTYILSVLERTGWRVSGAHGAAQILGLKPTTLEARMKKLQIARPR